LVEDKYKIRITTYVFAVSVFVKAIALFIVLNPNIFGRSVERVLLETFSIYPFFLIICDIPILIEAGQNIFRFNYALSVDERLLAERVQARRHRGEIEREWRDRRWAELRLG